MARLGKRKVIEALRKHHGVVAVAADELGSSRTAVYNYINDYKDVKQALDDAREEAKDFVEGKMFKQIEKGNPTMIIFYLKTQAKDRGYIERTEQEISGRGGGDIGLMVSKAIEKIYGDDVPEP